VPHRRRIQSPWFSREAGFQTGSNSNGSERAGLLLSGNFDYQINNNYTLKTGIFTGLHKVSFFELVQSNPFINMRADIDYIYDTPSLKSFIHYHNRESYTLSAGIKFSTSARTPVFDTLNFGTFDLLYERKNTIELISEGLINLTDNDNITYNMIFDYSSLSGSGKIAPYHPLLKINVDYGKRWFNDNFGTELGFIYIGKRYADIENKIEIDGYIDLRLKISYYGMEDLTAFINIVNLLDSDIYYWQGYKERGLYFGLGANYRF